MIHRSITVYGNVQGVFFRAETQKKAQSLGIVGFVRNEPNNSVFIEAEGNQAQLEQFIEWCHEGSSASRVERVEVEGGEVIGYTDFTIQRQ